MRRPLFALLFAPAVAAAQPDLRVNSVTVPPEIAPGSAFAADYQIRNLGTTAAFSVQTALWLSTDLNLDAADTSLCAHTLGTVDAGRNADGTASGCTVPSRTPAGLWYVLAEADAGDRIAESNEGNNLGSATIVVGVPGGVPDDAPDLRVTRVDAPDTLVPGLLIEADATVRNAGQTDAGSVQVQLRLSDDEALDAGDEVLCSARTGAVAADATVSVALTGCAVPQAADAGAAFLLATVDAASEELETDELNNTRAVAVTITAPTDGPDLTVEGVGDLPETGPGGRFDLEYRVRNDGSDGSGASRTRAFLSTDDRWDAGDAELCEAALASVPARTARTETLRGCEVPEGADPGAAFLIVYVDADNSLLEEVEANNVFVTPWTLGDPVVDTGGDTDDGPPSTFTDLGCGCAQGGPGATLPGFALAALGGWRRRRQGAST